MADELITTGVDDLLAYLKDKDKVPMQDAATVLNIPLETVQAWVDFLVEEKILGLEFKFTKPYIYLNKEQPKKAKLIEHTAVPIEDVRKEYFERARKRQIPEQKIPELWRGHVLEALEAKRGFFLEQATKRGVEKPEPLWDRYRQDILTRC